MITSKRMSNGKKKLTELKKKHSLLPEACSGCDGALASPGNTFQLCNPTTLHAFEQDTLPNERQGKEALPSP